MLCWHEGCEDTIAATASSNVFRRHSVVPLVIALLGRVSLSNAVTIPCEQQCKKGSPSMFLAYMYLPLSAWPDTAIQIETVVVSSLSSAWTSCSLIALLLVSKAYFHFIFSRPFLYATFLTHISHYLLH